MMGGVFDSSSQSRFVRISGDCNPIHVDSLAARRTQAGAPVVHGIHSLLYLVDTLAQSRHCIQRPMGLKARFVNPIYVGDQCRVRILSSTSEALRACLVVDNAETVNICVYFNGRQSAPSAPEQPLSCTSTPLPDTPNDLPIETLYDRTGSLAFGSMLVEGQAMFPHAARYLGPTRSAALICCSSLVGMVIPGRHSLFCGLDLSLVDEGPAVPKTLNFSVEAVDLRFRFVRIGVRAEGVSGCLQTMSRPPPVAQPTMRHIKSLVGSDEFRDSTALIVGGSRGLGELTAKLVAAGGGRVVVTYATGKADAEAVRMEIQDAGASCVTMPYDVRGPAYKQLGVLGDIVPTHIYYFATPPIFRRKAGVCDLRRLAEFNAFYVQGFLHLVSACLRLGAKGIRVFYPSTVFIQARPGNMTEYAMAKAAAEILCTDLEEYIPGVHVVTRRLPRLPTDQTSTVAPVETADAVGVMLPLVREMHARAM